MKKIKEQVTKDYIELAEIMQWDKVLFSWVEKPFKEYFNDHYHSLNKEDPKHLKFSHITIMPVKYE